MVPRHSFGAVLVLLLVKNAISSRPDELRKLHIVAASTLLQKNDEDMGMGNTSLQQKNDEYIGMIDDVSAEGNMSSGWFQGYGCSHMKSAERRFKQGKIQERFPKKCASCMTICKSGNQNWKRRKCTLHAKYCTDACKVEMLRCVDTSSTSLKELVEEGGAFDTKTDKCWKEDGSAGNLLETIDTSEGGDPDLARDCDGACKDNTDCYASLWYESCSSRSVGRGRCNSKCQMFDGPPPKSIDATIFSMRVNSWLYIKRQPGVSCG